MKNHRLLGGILLISGTTIGAAMLALPISTGIAGFFPALIIFAACWTLMYWTAGIFLELTLSFDGEVNLISMARKTLGPAGVWVAWCGFLLLLYSLLAAYMTGSGPLFMEGFEDLIATHLKPLFSPLPIVLFFGPFIYIGLQSVDYLNRYLMIGLVAAYSLMVFLLVPSVDISLLTHVDTNFTLLSFAVVITSFGYHIIIPSLSNYLDRDIKAVKQCIFWGSLIPFVIYLIWEVLILGNIPVRGELGLASLMNSGASISRALEASVGSTVIGYASRAFALFAIITSFIGVAQSLFDFLRDGLNLPKTHVGRAAIWLLTFLPPLIFVVGLQKGFLAVLEYAGVFIALLIGIVPILMVWSARYVKKLSSPYRAFGGKPGLVIGLVIYICIIALVVANNAGWLPVDLSGYLA